MPSNTLTTLQSTYKSVTRPAWPSQQAPGKFFDVHPVGAILRSVFLSSLLWIFLAFTLYKVFTYVVAAR